MPNRVSPAKRGRFARTLTVFFAASCLCGLTTIRADVVITELMYHPASDLETEEFLELHNSGVADVDIGNWCFDGIDFCFPAATILPAGAFFVLASDAAQFEATYGSPPDYSYLARLDNSGERIALLDAASAVMDEVIYRDVPPWPVTPDGLGPSLEVVDPTEDNAIPRNWRASTAPGGHTVGQTNSVAASGLPPWIERIVHAVEPGPGVDVVVTAQVHDAATVDFFYRIDFAAEVPIAMLDDGASNDGAAGDGVYGATIPGQPEGTLVRYRISASGAGGVMDFPRDDDTVQYDGTVVTDPALTSNLPVFWWFIHPDDYQAALDHRSTNELEPAVLYYDGVLIDAIEIRVRGQSARNYVKKHWKFHMPHGHDFFDPALVPVSLDQFNLQGNYSDKTYTREILSYSTFLEAGTPANITHAVRVQQNGDFYGLYTFVQAMDDDYLTTNGLDPNGAWYKAFDDCRFRTLDQLPGRYEKKTRRFEGHEDLFALLDGANNLTGQQRRNFLFDNVNLPGMINYLATTVVIHSTDFPHKNYFIYRDTLGTERWTMHPWDMDLTFGRNWQGTVLNDEIWADRDTIDGRPAAVSPSHPLVGEAEHQNWDTRWNKLVDALHNEPEFREMYYRRLRTLTDELLAVGKFEARIDELTAPKVAEADLDANLWGQYGAAQTMAEAAAILKTDYLQVRRAHLLTTHRIPGEVPEAQSAAPAIVISEIMYDPAGGPDHEFVELYNPSTTDSIDLSGYRLDGLGLTLPPGTVILPDNYLVVVRDDPAFRAEYGSGHFVPAQYGGALDNAGESLTLRDPDGSIVTRVDYSSIAPWPTAAAGDGSSAELIDPAADNGWVANWTASAAPGGTPGAPNGGAGSVGTHPGIYLNELLSMNDSINIDEQGDFDGWIELHNVTAAIVDLGGMTLTKSHAVPDMWEIPANTLLCGGCYLLIWADNETTEGPLHASFELNSFGGPIGLYDSAGGIVDYLNYPFLTSDTSFGRFPDGEPDQRVFTTVTPAAANDATLAPLILNEYNAVNDGEDLKNGGTDLYWGRVTGNGGDWFELVVTENHVDIRGWQLVLTDRTGAADEARQTLVFSNDPLWSDLRGGTLVTISEDLPDDPSFDPVSGDWWINVQASDGASGTYITAQDFTVSNNDWQMTILNALAQPIFGPVGEGVVPLSGIAGDEVFKLEEDPSPFATPFGLYNDGSSSSFGSPNLFAAGTLMQDFDTLRCGGQTCEGLDGPCTEGVCDTASGQCVAAPANQGATCDDGNDCTSGDMCEAGVCAGVEPDCSHLDDVCVIGACNPVTASCESVPADDGTACDDADACTSGESCNAGSCDLGVPIVCDDGNVCTADTCAAESGCIFAPDDDQDQNMQPDPCDDGEFCTVLDVCSAGVCGGVPRCEDANICTADICDGESCSYVASGECGLSGTVRYYRLGSQGEPGDAPVAGVDIDIYGNLVSDLVTQSDGSFAAPDLAGTFTVWALPRLGVGGVANANGAITSFDAALVAQHSIQSIELSAIQQMAADVSGNGLVSSFDAALVAQLSVQLLEHFPIALDRGTDWLFLRCDSYVSASDNDCGTPFYHHSPLEGPEQDDFYAVLYGDVSGNWTPAAKSASVPKLPPAATENRLDPSALVLSDGFSLTAREVAVRGKAPAGSRRIVISVNSAEPIQSLDVALRYDPDGVEVVTIDTTDTTSKFTIMTHDAGGTYRAALFSPTPTSRAGDLFTVTLKYRDRTSVDLELRINDAGSNIQFSIGSNDGGTPRLSATPSP